MIRYLCVWRVNNSLAREPGPHFGVEIAKIIGHLIADRLPTRQAAPWHKLLNEKPFINKQNPRPSKLPERLWPLDVVILPYPGKQTYGSGELILVEFKLFGESADHDIFLEMILPAMEEASYRKDPRWVSRNGLWGNFDLEAVHVAGAGRWCPLVVGGRLDFRYRPSPWHWSEARGSAVIRKPKNWSQMIWVNSFDLDHVTPEQHRQDQQEVESGVRFALSHILEALLLRLKALLHDAPLYPWGVWDLLDPDESEWLEIALLHGASIVHGLHDLSPTPPHVAGRWMGVQRFPQIPLMFLPYLDVAAILHVGRHTQFGCGSFVLA